MATYAAIHEALASLVRGVVPLTMPGKRFSVVHGDPSSAPGTDREVMIVPVANYAIGVYMGGGVWRSYLELEIHVRYQVTAVTTQATARAVEDGALLMSAIYSPVSVPVPLWTSLEYLGQRLDQPTEEVTWLTSVLGFRMETVIA